MEPEIVIANARKLVGKHLTITLGGPNTTEALWGSLYPYRHRIPNRASTDWISLMDYPPGFFPKIDQAQPIDRWAAVEVSDYHGIPPELDTYVIPEGNYAVFDGHGDSENFDIIKYIFNTWLRGPDYQLANGPHFQVMGSNYLVPGAEIDVKIWVPVMRRQPAHSPAPPMAIDDQTIDKDAVLSLHIPYSSSGADDWFLAYATIYYLHHVMLAKATIERNNALLAEIRKFKGQALCNHADNAMIAQAAIVTDEMQNILFYRVLDQLAYQLVKPENDAFIESFFNTIDPHRRYFFQPDEFVESYLSFADDLIDAYNNHYLQTPAGQVILKNTWAWEHLKR